MTARVGLVVNPSAGKGRGSAAGHEAHARLRALGLEVEDLSGPSLAQATDRARAGAVGDLAALVVVGGDGMVHLGANVVAGTHVPLGIVAAGLVLALSYLGGEAAQIEIGVTDKTVRAFQGMLLFFVLACDTLIHYQVRIVRPKPAQATESQTEAAHGHG